jgi:hypothetical protein
VRAGSAGSVRAAGSRSARAVALPLTLEGERALFGFAK